MGMLVAIAPGGNAAHSLPMCVDQAGTNVDLGDARERIKRAMKRDVEEHPRFEAVGYSRNGWTLAKGCPSAPALLQSGDRHFKLGGSALVGRTDKASGIRAFVYIVSADAIERMFGDLTYRTATQEIICSDDHCAAVSTAYYITPEELALSDTPDGRSRIARGLVQAIGLEAPVLIDNRQLGPKQSPPTP